MRKLKVNLMVLLPMCFSFVISQAYAQDYYALNTKMTGKNGGKITFSFLMIRP